MHVQAAEQIAATDDLEILHHALVARRFGGHLFAPFRERMRAGGHEAHAVLESGRGKFGAQIDQTRAQFDSVVADRRGGLDLRLHQFIGGVPGDALVAGAHEARGGTRHDEAAGGIREEELLLDADAVVVRHGSSL